MYIASDKKGYVVLFPYEKPVRDEERGIWVCPNEEHKDCCCEVGRSEDFLLTWNDEPRGVGLCLNNEKYHTVSVYQLDTLLDHDLRYYDLDKKFYNIKYGSLKYKLKHCWDVLFGDKDKLFL